MGCESSIGRSTARRLWDVGLIIILTITNCMKNMFKLNYVCIQNDSKHETKNIFRTICAVIAHVYEKYIQKMRQIIVQKIEIYSNRPLFASRRQVGPVCQSHRTKRTRRRCLVSVSHPRLLFVAPGFCAPYVSGCRVETTRDTNSVDVSPKFMKQKQ